MQIRFESPPTTTTTTNNTNTNKTKPKKAIHRRVCYRISQQLVAKIYPEVTAAAAPAGTARQIKIKYEAQKKTINKERFRPAEGRYFLWRLNDKNKGFQAPNKKK